VWPGEAPDSGRRALHSLVSRLRNDLGTASDRLVRDTAGYRLDLDRNGLDMADARELAERARSNGGPTRPSCWSGPWPSGAARRSKSSPMSRHSQPRRSPWMSSASG
jgi:hypothetical protein